MQALAGSGCVASKMMTVSDVRKQIRAWILFSRAFLLSMLDATPSNSPLMTTTVTSTGPAPPKRKFAMIVERQPLSINAAKPTPFVNHVKGLASTAFAGQPQLSGELYARVVWFHRNKATTDAD